VSRLAKCQPDALRQNIGLAVLLGEKFFDVLVRDRPVASTFRILRQCPLTIRFQRKDSSRTGQHRESSTVLYKKIRLRCTKLYYRWQTIIPIAPESLNLLLKSSSKSMKNISIAKIYRNK
jgi:hypothetical protein